MKNYYIADLHLFHKSMLQGSYHPMDERPFNSIEEMHQTIEENWNQRIHADDHVYLLGDVEVKAETKPLIEFVSMLKGNKHLIIGGHDKHIKESRYRQLFVEITDYKEMVDHVNGVQHRLVLSHYPIFSWNGCNRSVIQIYGHVHDTWEHDQFKLHLKRMNEHYRVLDEARYKPILAFNAGCMLHNYTPVTLQELMEETDE